jgi:hypothetical protein
VEGARRHGLEKHDLRPELQTTTLFASDRDLFIFLVDDLNPIQIGTVKNKVSGLDEPDILFRGFYITNSEVGKSIT